MKRLDRWIQRLKANFEVSLSVMLAYRENLIYFLVFESLFILAQLLTVKVGFDVAGGALNGWTREEAYFLTAINGLSHQVFITFFINGIFGISQTVWNGAFDYILLKPIPPLVGSILYGQMIVSNFPSMVINTILVIATYIHAQHSGSMGISGMWGVWGFMLGGALFFLGVAVRISLALLVMTPVFISERLADGESSFWALVRLSGYPMNIYWTSIEKILTFVVPIAMMAHIPAAVALGQRESLQGIIVATLASIAFVVLSYRVFCWGVSQYKSVNSGTY